VDSDEDPTHADRDGRQDEHQAETSADEKHRERDRERCYRVVARKRRLARARDEQDRLQWVCVEGTLAYPDVGDDLADGKAEPGGDETREQGDLPAIRPARSIQDPERERRDDEERNRPERHVVLDPVGDRGPIAKRPVQEVEERPVDRRRVARLSSLERDGEATHRTRSSRPAPCNEAPRVRFELTTLGLCSPRGCQLRRVWLCCDNGLSPDFPLGDGVEVFVRREDAERFIEEVRGDDPEIAAKLRIEERELETGGSN
jgi:hypothetical protein